MIIKLHHPDGTEMNVDSENILEVVEHITRDGFYTTVNFEDHHIVCVEKIKEIQSMLGEKDG